MFIMLPVLDRSENCSLIFVNELMISFTVFTVELIIEY